MFSMELQWVLRAQVVVEAVAVWQHPPMFVLPQPVLLAPVGVVEVVAEEVVVRLVAPAH